MLRLPPASPLFPYTTLFRSVVFVFLVLAAQYESLPLPLAVILIVPMCLLAAILGDNLRGMDNNILTQDRKSTRLNSSHVRISYAVFCLKKKKTHREPTRTMP